MAAADKFIKEPKALWIGGISKVSNSYVMLALHSVCNGGMKISFLMERLAFHEMEEITSTPNSWKFFLHVNGGMRNPCSIEWKDE